MNKKLIALAIAGASVVPAAMAQSGPVTLYGRVYETFESVSAKADGAAADVPSRTRVTDQASLLGVRGTEDLGGGLKAFFQLETAFSPNNSPTAAAPNAFANRNSAVGLEGGWGSLLIGRWDTPYKVSTYPIDAFGDLTLGGITGVGHGQASFDRRDPNIVQYWSPNFGGFAIKLMTQSTQNKTATSNPHDDGASVTYNGGPLYAFFAYESHKDPSATQTKQQGYSGGGAYTFGPLKAGLVYESIKTDAAQGATSVSDRKSWLASLVYTMGHNKFIYQYQNGKDGAASNAATQPSCNSNTLAYEYVFSKRTFFLAQYVTVKNNKTATCNFGSGTLAIAADNDPSGVAVGIQHVF